MLKRGILAEIPRIEGRDFYPLLAKVGYVRDTDACCAQHASVHVKYRVMLSKGGERPRSSGFMAPVLHMIRVNSER